MAEKSYSAPLIPDTGNRIVQNPVGQMPKRQESPSHLSYAFQSQQLREQTYQRLSRQLLTLPFVGLLLIVLSMYSLFDLYQNLKSKLHYSTTVSSLIAQSASNQYAELVNTQTQYALAHSPFIDSITFYPISGKQNPANTNDNLSLSAIFLHNQLGISEPVSISSYRDPQSRQLIGYIHTTLNLQKARGLWLANNFPILLLVFIATGLMLLVVLRRIGQITKRLPPLEKISQAIVENHQDLMNEPQINQYLERLAKLSLPTKNSLRQSPQRVWVFEKVLIQLLSLQRVQVHQMTKLTHDHQRLQDKMTAHMAERSHFENALIHEFKIALDKMQAGMYLLKNQYMSQEQKDALDIIQTGHRELSVRLNQIIELQRIEKGQVGIQLEQVNPAQLLQHVVATYQPFAVQKGLALNLVAPHTDYLLEGDRQKISDIIAGLIENAIKFTEKGTITVTSQLVHLPQNVRWQIMVQDTGIGIPAKHLQDIFEPFFEVNPDTAASQNDWIITNTLGGVDLSVAHKLSKLLGGRLTVESEVGMGSTFTLSLKLEEWRKHFERVLLKDKTLTVFYQGSELPELVETLATFGATVTAFNDEQLLINQLNTVPTDAVLFLPDVNITVLTSLVQYIRQYETRHRTLMIAYYLDHQPPHSEALQAVGVDYLEVWYPDAENQEPLIKQLMVLLD